MELPCPTYEPLQDSTAVDLLDAPTALTFEYVIHDFATVRGRVPVESIDWCLEHWDEVAPKSLALLNRYIDGEDESEETVDSILIFAHLLGERRETVAFPVLCRLMHAREKCEMALDYAITETLPRILTATFDGNLGLLLDVIEDEAADQFVRNSCLDVFSGLSFSGLLPGFDATAYLETLYDTLQPQDTLFVWVGWTEAVTNLCIVELFDKAREAYRKGFVDELHSHEKHLEAGIAQVLADPANPPRLQQNSAKPLRSTKEELSDWYSFSPAWLEKEKRREGNAELDPEEEQAYRELWGRVPAINLNRDVGRNDPCPCGSGKKFKKCCYR